MFQIILELITSLFRGDTSDSDPDNFLNFLKGQKKSLIKIRLKNENSHKHYIFRGAVTA
jgi:hypothetical protein